MQGLAIVSLGLERVLKVLEEIRDRTALPITPREVDRVDAREREVARSPANAVPA